MRQFKPGQLQSGSLYPITASNAVTASYVLNALSASYAVSASYEINYETSSSYAETASFATSASYALTASYVTASSVHGPYGANSIISASYTTNALNAQDILVYVQNNSGYNIAKGTVVHITASGNSSDTPRIISASYENDANSANTLGIANESIANGGNGYVMTEGILKGIDTSAFISGQMIYLGASGSIIGSAPQAPLHAVRIGQVVRVQQNNGSVYVRIDNGYELDELHDVRIMTASLQYGDLLMRSGSVWTNSKQLSGSYALTGSLTATSFSGSLFGTASNAVSASIAANANNAGAIDIFSFGAPVESYLLMSNVIATTGVAVGGDADLRYNSSTNTLSAVNISATNITGSLLGTASFATSASRAVSSSFATTASFASTASFVATAQTASYVLNAVSASFATSASRAVTASFATTASHAVTASKSSIQILTNFDTRSFALTMVESNTSSSTNNPASIAIHTGTPLTYTVAGGVGTLNTTSSFATSASYAQTSSIATSASFASTSTTASFASTATTASHALEANTVLPLGGNKLSGFISYVISTGSMQYVRAHHTLNIDIPIGGATSTVYLTGSLVATSITSSLQGSASFANTSTSASYAVTASYLDNYVPPFPYTGSAIITGSLTVIDENQIESINTDVGLLRDINGQAALEWKNRRYLRDNLEQVVVDWDATQLLDTPAGILSVSWNDRVLYDQNGTDRLAWSYDDRAAAIEQFAYSRNYIDLPSTAETLANQPQYGKYLPTGETLQGVTFDVAVVDFDLVYLDTDNTWYPVDASTSSATRMLGIAYNVASQNYVLLEGTAVVNDNALTDSPQVTSIQTGTPIYINTSTAGIFMSTTVPSNAGDHVRLLGYAYYQSVGDSQYWLMKFKPSNDWYVI